MNDIKRRQHQINEAQLKSAGFIPYKGSDNNPDFSLIAIAPINQNTHLNLELRFSPNDQDHIYVVMQEEPKWLHIPIALTFQALTKVQEYYVKPGASASSSLFGLDLLAQIDILRRTRNREYLPRNNIKTVAWFIGAGDYDELMTALENNLTMCPWLATGAIRQATGSGGRFSQWYTAFSHSLITITRYPVVDQCLFTLEVQYSPSFHTEFTKKCLAKNAQEPLKNSVPDDVPIDSIGLLVYLDVKILQTKKELLNKVHEGDVGALLPLAVLTSDKEFEEVFLPFAESENPEYRDFVASEAVFRKSKKVFDVAKTRGISKDIEMFPGSST